MKSKKPSPPDPALVQAQTQSLNVQTDVMRDVLALSREMQPLQREQLQTSIDATRQAMGQSQTAFEQSQADREWMLGRRGALTGIQDKIVADANAFSVEDRGSELAGKASTDVSQAFAAQRAAMGRNMERMGINPADAKYGSNQDQVGIAEALAQVHGKGAAREAARREGYQLTDRANNTLAGYPAMSMQATQQGLGASSTAAQIAAGGVGLMNQGVGGMVQPLTTAAGVAGQAGANATGMWQAQAQRYDNRNSGVGSMLGGIGGLIKGAATVFSDRRLKQDIVAVGKHAPTGLTLYEFAYKADPERRFVGVMADEVQKVLPDAVRFDEQGFARVDYTQLGFDMKELA